jgi:hypothetical protein
MVTALVASLYALTPLIAGLMFGVAAGRSGFSADEVIDALHAGAGDLDDRMQGHPWGLVHNTIGQRTGVGWTALYTFLAIACWPCWLHVQIDVTLKRLRDE